MQGRTSQKLQEEDPQARSLAIPPEEIEAELQKILSSRTFRNAPRHCRFLNFVVREVLTGKAEAVKESVIGVEVFDRPPDYDPGTNPIVRAEARRLRSRLVDYYKTLGKLDPVRIDLPKGTYVPVFYRNGVEPPLDTTSDTELMIRIPGRENEVTVRHAYGPRLRWLAIAAVVIVAAIAAGFFASRRPAKFTDKDSIVLADFDNKTGDIVFDDTLKQGLSVQLEQSPFLDLVSETKTNETLKLMGRKAGDRLTPEVARRSASVRAAKPC